jgi:hypothetical protein
VISPRLVALLFAAWLFPAASSADPFVATLRLDPFSIVSFGDQEVYALPEGSEIRFEFAKPEGERSLAFVVRPRDAAIAEIPLEREGESLRFTLARTATGVMRVAEDGRPIIEIDAYVVVTLEHPETPGAKRFPIRLTTESAQARSAAGDRVIPVSGGRVSGRGVQLVGTATAAANDYPGSGAPVYVMLSGAFDRLPTQR